MTHALTAKRIHHTGRVTDRNKLPGQTNIRERTGHHTVRTVNILLQSVLLDEEAPIRASAFHRNAAPVPIFKEPEIQYGPSRLRLRILDTKFVHVLAFREATEFP